MASLFRPSRGTGGAQNWDQVPGNFDDIPGNFDQVGGTGGGPAPLLFRTGSPAPPGTGVDWDDVPGNWDDVTGNFDDNH